MVAFIPASGRRVYGYLHELRKGGGFVSSTRNKSVDLNTCRTANIELKKLGGRAFGKETDKKLKSEQKSPIFFSCVD